MSEKRENKLRNSTSPIYLYKCLITILYIMNLFVIGCRLYIKNKLFYFSIIVGMVTYFVFLKIETNNELYYRCEKHSEGKEV